MADQPCEAVVVRSGQEPIVVNLDIQTAENAGTGGLEVPFPSRTWRDLAPEIASDIVP